MTTTGPTSPKNVNTTRPGITNAERGDPGRGHQEEVHDQESGEREPLQHRGERRVGRAFVDRAGHEVEEPRVEDDPEGADDRGEDGGERVDLDRCSGFDDLHLDDR